MWDEWGNYYVPPASGGIDFGQIISQGLDVIGSVFSGSPYVGAGDPRYQRGNFPVNQNYGGGVPATYNYCDGLLIGGSLSAGGGGTSGGFCVSKTMMVVGGIAAAFFVFGQRRGRRS